MLYASTPSNDGFGGIAIKYIAVIASLFLIAIDQFVKSWAISVLKPLETIVVIPRLFSLTYVENRGAAFGILQNHTIPLAIITSAVLLAVLWYLLSGRLTSRCLIISFSLVIAGGAGNLIDRVGQGFVVDYLDFSSLFGFPVFNLADCYVVAGTITILAYVLFEERWKKKKKPVM